jgi:predicted MPP superfamily phosphohydrolase
MRPNLPWARHLQFSLSHTISRPLYWLFSQIPHYEYGLATPTVTRLESSFEPLKGRRAVHISDLHLDYYLPRHDVFVQTIAELRPDWIFVTGDLLNVPDGLPHLFRFLSHLRNLAPVCVTLGNHDHYSGVPVADFIELSDRHKLHLLINQTIVIPLSGGELCVVGLDDPTTHRADVTCIPHRVPGRYTVVLAHAPVVLDLLDPDHAVEIILCGHSHGGQWRFGSVHPFWLPYGCRGRAHGHYTQDGQRLYVNRGLGWSLVPLRWNCSPEIVLLEWV